LLGSTGSADAATPLFNRVALPTCSLKERIVYLSPASLSKPICLP